MRIKIFTFEDRKKAGYKYGGSDENMFVKQYGKKIVYICGGLERWNWMGDKLEEYIPPLFSHEAIHIALENISHTASVKLDNTFNRIGSSDTTGMGIKGGHFV